MTTHTNLSTFDFNGNGLRVIDRDGEPWFVAADVCRALGLNTAGGASRHFGNLNPSEVASLRLKNGGKPNSLISESGLYKLVMRSDKPEAKAFQDWVTKEVLPAIRKTGGYLLNEDARDTAQASDRAAMPLPEEFAQAFAKLAAVLDRQNDLLERLLEDRKAAPPREKNREMLTRV